MKMKTKNVIGPILEKDTEYKLNKPKAHLHINCTLTYKTEYFSPNV